MEIVSKLGSSFSLGPFVVVLVSCATIFAYFSSHFQIYAQIRIIIFPIEVIMSYVKQSFYHIVFIFSIGSFYRVHALFCL